MDLSWLANDYNSELLFYMQHSYKISQRVPCACIRLF